MIKNSGLEETKITDPKTGKDIFVSTTARLVFRKYWPDKFGFMRNANLNEIIAKNFSSQHDVVHYFWIDKTKRIIAEIRQGDSGFFYISAIRDNRIDIITIQSQWLRPKYRRHTSTIPLGEE